MSPPATLIPCTPHDLPLLAKIESTVFLHDPFAIVAFGPKKDTAENLALRTKGLLKTLKPQQGKRTKYVKAVLGGVVVGWSSWSFVDVGEGVVKGGAEGEGDGEGEGKGEEKEEDVGWGISANIEFLQDVFIKGDEMMMKSTDSKPYAKLNALVILPPYQRRGIGTLLLSEGLKEVDALGLQCVLGASPEGYGLYERYGFKEVGMMELKLWEYEGGEGLGETRHGVMRRAPQGV
ncbi:Acyl-CoA N-acyltransferases (Nat) [Glarea lozoyensis ATCC 20868]|uniref:Acyl-CoA N-acyltransferases (Nat) n=1 Tax=Glarea lozoyensis (strain ATCC 20868 / MF5171) TaxID=1116229 RepID=S3CPZ0_GLAL2|nr:Acyl-CoA N-acyltransferases (Nat) [Glarea lozoyensis ATCC 20868]EPE28552.1 Acyl-CoA N-acyltransferases (Nat) [Glarea lozoyensis ATCC 20868]